MNWIVGWNLRSLTTFFDVVSFFTSAEAGIIYSPVGIGFLLGETRAAVVVQLAEVAVP